MSFASAGHLPPLLHRDDTSEFVDTPSFPPAGVFDAVAIPPTAEFTLRPGDALLFYTDGLVERRGETLDAGMQRLADATRLTSPDNASRLTSAALTGCLDDTHRADDACVLAVLRHTQPEGTKS
jgi:serine phosphatase RsbU (regulator of sigma subunit)